MVISSRKNYNWETEDANELLLGHGSYFFMVARMINRCSTSQNIDLPKHHLSLENNI